MVDGASTGEVTRGPSSKGFKPADWFWESRKKGTSSASTVVFTLLRIADLPLQWWFLHSGAGAHFLHALGAKTVPQPLLTPTGTTFLGLTPYHTLILSLAVGSSLKQIYWKVFVGDTVMPMTFSVLVAIYNTALNSFNTLLALWALTSQQPTNQTSLRSFLVTAPPSLYAGLALYATGLFVEWYCEIQRKAFKADPANKGQLYTGGLFSLARNINYGGYTLWRAGYSLICGGWTWAAVMTAWLAGDFCARAIPSMETYLEKRYGAQWDEVQRKVPYKLLPWIY